MPLGLILKAVHGNLDTSGYYPTLTQKIKPVSFLCGFINLHLNALRSSARAKACGRAEPKLVLKDELQADDDIGPASHRSRTQGRNVAEPL
jgi:hypothetical protein